MKNTFLFFTIFIIVLFVFFIDFEKREKYEPLNGIVYSVNTATQTVAVEDQPGQINLIQDSPFQANMPVKYSWPARLSCREKVRYS